MACGFVLVIKVGLMLGCVDKAPPALWPAPPPPTVAEQLGDPGKKALLPAVVVGAPALTGPPSKLDRLPADKSSLLDPDGQSATAAAQADSPSSSRPVPTHR